MVQIQRWLGILLAAVLLPSTVHCESAETQEEQIYGWIERVALHPSGVILKAKLDSGARTSSLHAHNLSLRQENGSDWVRFTVDDPDDKPVELDLPVSRWVRIKRHGVKSQRRPVVELGICLDDVYREVEVSLTDRSEFNYRILLGRNFLAGVAYIDSDRTFTTDPKCSEPEPSPATL